MSKALSLGFLPVLIFAASAHAQIAQMSARTHDLAIDSGVRGNSGDSEAVVYSQSISVSNGLWVRLVFDSATLEPGSYVRITSIETGESQKMTAEDLDLWNNMSMKVAGASFLVELIAAPGTSNNSVTIHKAIVGDLVEPPAAKEKVPPERLAVCTPYDRRRLADQNATARLSMTIQEPEGVCTGFLARCTNRNEWVMLSANHCFEGSNLTLAEFKDPAVVDQGTCTAPASGAAKQFPVTAAQRRSDSNDLGNDWAVFRLGRNSAGMTVQQVQAAAFSIDLNGAVAGSNVTIFGYGADGASRTQTVARRRHCVTCGSGTPAERAKNTRLQQDSRTILRVAGDVIRHDVHTCGGNSGSPIVDDAGNVVGIHTRGGCVDETQSIDGVFNGATNTTNARLRQALTRMCQICDVAPANGNGVVNQADIDAIANAIANGPIAATGPDDRRDANGDGMITQGDRGTCQQLCTNANCQ